MRRTRILRQAALEHVYKVYMQTVVSVLVTNTWHDLLTECTMNEKFSILHEAAGAEFI